MTSAAIGVGLIVDGLEWLDEDAGYKVGGVHDRQRLQQPVGGALFVTPAVSSQHGHRQSVTNPANHAQYTHHVDVDHQSVRGHDGVTR